MTATQWGEVLASYSLQVFVVMMFGRWLERAAARPSYQSAVWSGCFVSTLVLGCVAVILPRLHLIQPWSLLQPRHLLTASAVQAYIGRLLLAVWCIGASISAVKWVTRGILLRRYLRRCQPVRAEEARQILGIGEAELKTKVLPSLLVSDEAEGPFCCQLHQPVIVLPRFLLEGSRDDLRHVLIHEVEHLATNHPLQLFITQLAQVVCWFHPAVWIAASRASLVREFVCDDAAAAQGANCAAYLRTLLHIAERCEQNNKSQAIGFSKNTNEIIIRAHRLVTLTSAASRGRLNAERWRRWASCLLIPTTCALALTWLPLDPLSSSRSRWSPWPTWTAKSLHCLDVNVRDYEVFDRRVQLYELAHEQNEGIAASSDEL